MEKCIRHYRNIRIHIRFAQSLMALNVSLKFSLFGTRYKISSVTRQPEKKRQKKCYIPTVNAYIPGKRQFQFRQKKNLFRFIYLPRITAANVIDYKFILLFYLLNVTMENCTSNRPQKSISTSLLYAYNPMEAM